MIREWICPVCGYVHIGETPPEKCPVCGISGDLFEEKEAPYKQEELEEIKQWRCSVCGYIYEGPEPPEECPICGVGPEFFELAGDVIEEAPIVKKWRCTVCGYVYEGNEPPEVCPICGVGADMFELVEEGPQEQLSAEEQERLQSLLFGCSYGLYIMTAHEDEFSNGMVCNTFQQVTDSPLRVSFCINKGGKTSQMISKTKAACCNILGQDNMDLIPKFGSMSGHVVNKCEGIPYVNGEITGCPVLEQTLYSIELEVEKEIDLGTHRMFIARVVGGKKNKEGTPMTYAWYRENRPKK